MLSLIANICILTSVILDSSAYLRQDLKIIRTRSSKDISSSSFYLRFWKDVTAIASCIIYQNWVGTGLASVGLLWCLITIVLIVKHKPKEWKEKSRIAQIL